MQILLHVSDALFNWQESVNSSHQVFFYLADGFGGFAHVSGT